MTPIYARIQKRARQIVSQFPTPGFYRRFPRAVASSRRMLNTHPEILKLHAFVKQHLEDDFGHGLKHSEKVALDAGTLMILECSREDSSQKDDVERKVIIVQSAALLHDIKRKEQNHAKQGAAYALEALQSFAFSEVEVADICRAIGNHTAFKLCLPIDSAEGALVSDCLYDADKFRWGPDNFTDTIWEMVSLYNPPLTQFMRHYPEGMETLARIKSTFRTATGKKHGPQFIDLGLAIGREIYKMIETEFLDQ